MREQDPPATVGVTDFHAEAFSTSYELLPDGSTKLVVATVENGEIFSMRLGPEETVRNLEAWAKIAGLLVARPL